MELPVKSKRKDSFSKDLPKRRTVFSIMNVVGKRCQIKTTDNKTLNGVVYSFSEEGLVAYDCTMDKKSLGNLKLSFQDVVNVQTKATVIGHRTFLTDQQISKKRKTKQKELVQWEGSSEIEETDLSVPVKWDQFTVNKEKFGVESTFDESLYTTRKVNPEELSEAQRKEALKVAAELGEGNLSQEEEQDEEALYGAVLGSGRYLNRKRTDSEYSTPNSETKLEYKQLRNALSNPKHTARKQCLLYNERIAALDPMIYYQPLNPEAEEKLEKFKSERKPRKRLTEDLKEFAKNYESSLKRKQSVSTPLNPLASDFVCETFPPPESLVDTYISSWTGTSSLTYQTWSYK